MRNLIKPVFTEKGGIAGFELRTELAPLVYQQDDYQFGQISRVIKTCINLNRLIKDGISNEYVLKLYG